MSEYAIYKLWNDRVVPNNLVHDGRLIGALVPSINTSSNKDTDNVTTVSQICTGKYYCIECDYQFRYKKDAQTFNYCPICGRKIVKR